MKTLTLIRHAKSSWKSDVSDFERPLNDRGMRDAPVMGKRLAQRQLIPDLIITSPALRAITTARVIATEINYAEGHIQTDASIYEASVGALVNVITHIDDQYNNVMMLGHNPGFTYIIDWLSGTQVGNLPTCGIFSMHFELDTWSAVIQQSGTMNFFDYPKNPED